MINGHISDVVAEDREVLSRAARVRVRCKAPPGHVPIIADLEVLAVLEDGTEVPLRGVEALRIEAAVETPSALVLAVRFCDFEADVEAPALEAKS
jgi:hypothetical protein